jgi:hypothetical protein
VKRVSEPGREYRALLIGNSEFPGDPANLRRLLGPPTDVQMLSAALTDTDTGLHQADAVRTVLEETSQRIEEELAEFLESALPHEQLFLYYSGHGLLDLRNRLRLCARDTTLGRLRARSVGLGFINELIEDCAARSIVVVLDCCFSGAAAAKGTDPTAQLAGHGRFVMTSSSQADTSADAERAGAVSPFTRHLVTGLRSGAPGRDGYATAYDVYRYVHGRLRASGQIPHMKTETGVGVIPLARRPMRSAEAGTAEGPVRTAGDDAVPFDVRPIFTDREGNRAQLTTHTDFTGVLHVRLPGHRTVLTTHRDRIAETGEGRALTAELYRRADVTWRGIHARVTGRKVADLRADAMGGAVSFRLPDGAGTVEWPESQVHAFRQARSQGHWPGSPLAPSRGTPATDAYTADSGYRRLMTAAWMVLPWFSAFVVAGSVAGVLASLAWYARVGGAVFALASLFSLVQVLSRLRDAWRFFRVRSMLRSSGLSATLMVMATGMVKELSSDGINGIELDIPCAWLWREDAPLVAPTPDELSRRPPEREATPERPSLTVRLHSFHFRYIKERNDLPDTPVIEHVEVIGNPNPGHWVAIRTQKGMLWPHAKAR